MPNDLWCADFKGEFKLGNGRYCTSIIGLMVAADVRGAAADTSTIVGGQKDVRQRRHQSRLLSEQNGRNTQEH